MCVDDNTISRTNRRASRGGMSAPPPLSHQEGVFNRQEARWDGGGDGGDGGRGFKRQRTKDTFARGHRLHFSNCHFWTANCDR